MAGKYGIPHVFTDYRAMLDQGDIDAVVLSGELDALDLDFNCSPPYALRGARRGGEGFRTLPIPQHLLGSMAPDCPWFENMGRIFVDGVKAQAVIDAAFESDHTGCWVDVPTKCDG